MRKRFEQQMEIGRIPIGETDITIKKRSGALPGYHGKGGYSSQGLVVMSNNWRIGTGGVGGSGLIDFRLPGGCLASWNGEWGEKLSPKGVLRRKIINPGKRNRRNFISVILSFML